MTSLETKQTHRYFSVYFLIKYFLKKQNASDRTCRTYKIATKVIFFLAMRYLKSEKVNNLQWIETKMINSQI